jgi:uncharacterized protein
MGQRRRIFFYHKNRSRAFDSFPQEKIPSGVLYEPNWRAFRIEGIVEGIYAVGIIEILARPLAENKIPIFNISTYQTNYIFVKEKKFKKSD